VKCELLEVELTEKHLWLIFKNYYKAEKSLPCLFCHIYSTTYFDLNPVWLDGAFHELSKYIKFAKFGSVDIFLFTFEVSIRLQIEGKRIKQFLNSKRGRETRLGQGEVKWAGPAELPRGRERPDGGVHCQPGFPQPEAVRDEGRQIKSESDGARSSSSSTKRSGELTLPATAVGGRWLT
jgi:hypothetical protein